MDLLTVVTALFVQYLRPSLRWPYYCWQGYDRVIRALQHWLDGGLARHGVYAWLLAVLPPVVLVWLISALLGWLHPWLCWPWQSLVVLICISLSDWSRAVRRIGGALAANDLPLARERLASRGIVEADDQLLARRGIEYALEQSQRQIFGALFWYAVLPGPVGALLYRAAQQLARAWPDQDEEHHFGWFAQRAAYLLDWLPARITAASFAVVGHFEEALEHWTRARRLAPLDIVIYTGSGAIGVRLPAPGDDHAPETPDDHLPDADDLLSLQGLVWRALGLWLLVMFLFGFSLAMA